MNEPIYDNPPDGYVVIVSFLSGDKKLCQDKSYFWGNNAWIQAIEFHNDTLVNEAIHSLMDAGLYEVVIYPAWRGKGEEPDEYDALDALYRTKFMLHKKAFVELIEQN